MLNIFPATINVAAPIVDGVHHPPHTIYSTARVRTNNTEDQRIQVWVRAEAYPREPICVIDSNVYAIVHPYNPWAPRRERFGVIELTDGTLLTIRAEPGCGCSSPLRNLPTWSKNNQAMVPVDA